MTDLFNWIVAGVTALIGILGGVCTVGLPVLIQAVPGIHLVRRNRESSAARQEAQSWPGTNGVVLASTIQVQRTGRSRSEITVVLYQYEVNGKMYQNHAIRAGDRFLNIRVAGQARATVARYPADPAESALER